MAEYRNIEAFSMTMTKNFCFDKLKSKQAQNLKLVHSNYESKNTPLQKQMELKDSVSRKTIREKLTNTHNYGVR